MGINGRYITSVMLVLFLSGALAHAAPGMLPALGSVASVDSPFRDLSRKEIKKTLQQVAEKALHNGNGKLTASGRDHLNDMLAGAAARVFAVPAPSNSQSQRLELAEEGTRRLINTALGIARNLQGNTPQGNRKLEVNEDVLVRAWRICPLYPFC